LLLMLLGSAMLLLLLLLLLPLLLLSLLPGLMVTAWCTLCASKMVLPATATDGCPPADWPRLAAKLLTCGRCDCCSCYDTHV
jgi:hypothetical protein